MRDDLDAMLDLPEMQAVSVQALRQAGRIPGLPQMPGRSIDKYFMTNYRAEEAAALAYALKAVYEERRRRDIIMRAKARAAEKIAQAIAEYRIRQLD